MGTKKKPGKPESGNLTASERDVIQRKIYALRKERAQLIRNLEKLLVRPDEESKQDEERKIEKCYAMAGLDVVNHAKMRPLLEQIISICDKKGLPLEDFEAEFREIGSYIKSIVWSDYVSDERKDEPQA